MSNQNINTQKATNTPPPKIPPHLIDDLNKLKAGKFKSIDQAISNIKDKMEKNGNLTFEQIPGWDTLKFDSVCQELYAKLVCRLYPEIVRLKQTNYSVDLFARFEDYIKKSTRIIVSFEFFNDPKDLQELKQNYYSLLAHKVAEDLIETVEQLKEYVENKVTPIKIDHDLYEKADLFEKYVKLSKLSQACFCFNIEGHKTAHAYAKQGFKHILSIYIELISKGVNATCNYNAYKEALKTSKINLAEDCNLTDTKVYNKMFKSMARNLNAMYHDLVDSPEACDDINETIKKLIKGHNIINPKSNRLLHYKAEDLTSEKIRGLHWKKADYMLKQLKQTNKLEYYDLLVMSMKPAKATYKDFDITEKEVLSLIKTSSVKFNL